MKLTSIPPSLSLTHTQTQTQNTHTRTLSVSPLSSASKATIIIEQKGNIIPYYIATLCSLSSAHLYEGHVDLIDIRSLFSVHFDAHKVLAEQRANLLALKRLPLHHVTPVAGTR